MDRLTAAVMSGDSDELKALYAPDAVAETPDQGTIRGRDLIAAYMGEFATAFPDASWEELYKHETGDTAIDEGYFIGTNTGPMTGPNGETIAATGKRVRARECDVATVQNGVNAAARPSCAGPLSRPVSGGASRRTSSGTRTPSSWPARASR